MKRLTSMSTSQEKHAEQTPRTFQPSLLPEVPQDVCNQLSPRHSSPRLSILTPRPSVTRHLISNQRQTATSSPILPVPAQSFPFHPSAHLPTTSSIPSTPHPSLGHFHAYLACWHRCRHFSVTGPPACVLVPCHSPD